MSKNKDKSFRREALQATFKKRKECSTKALETVERLIEKNITHNVLLQNIHFINQSSYQDVIDERSIMNICGYPICNNELRNIPKQQYKITRTNGTLQLYDTTERKKFCSNFCYKAAKYLKDQLPSCPLWLIEPKAQDYYKLMPLDCKIGGMLGEQINFALNSICEMDKNQEISYSSEKSKTENVLDKTDEKVDNVILSNCDKILCNKTDEENDEDVEIKTSEEFSNNVTDKGVSINLKGNKLIYDNNKIIINDNYQSELENIHSTVDVKKEHFTSGFNNHVVERNELDSRINGVITYRKEKQYNSNESVQENTCDLDQTNKLNPLLKVNCNKIPEDMRVDDNVNKMKKVKIKKSKVSNEISPMIAAVLRTEQCIREWVSLDTLYFLLGEDKLRNMIKDTCGLDNFQHKTQSSMQDPAIYEKYLDICKKLNLLELNESKFDKGIKCDNEESIGKPTKPVPDFEKLKKETKEMEIKVRSFYRGDRQVRFNDVAGNDDKSNSDNFNYLPPVDQHAQKALRRRIVMDSLNKVLPDLFCALGIVQFKITINSDVKQLVESFTLSPHNITFRPAEWNFVAMIIIKLLSVRDNLLEKALLMERADKYLTLMLMSYEQDSGYLNRLLTWLLYEHTLFNI